MNIAFGFLIAFAILFGAAFYYMCKYSAECRADTVDRKKEILKLVSKMDAEDLRKWVYNAIDIDRDVYDYIEEVDRKSSEFAQALREHWASDGET